MIFDYAGTGTTRRFVQLRLGPGAVVPAWRCAERVECWVRGGRLLVGDRLALADTFVVVEPGATVRLVSPNGALLLAWAEGPEHWLEAVAPGGGAVPLSLFGF
jgi:hypothetical protein